MQSSARNVSDAKRGGLRRPVILHHSRYVIKSRDRSTRLPSASEPRCTTSPACLTTDVATRFARATGDCLRARLRPRERFRADDFRTAEPRADDLRRDDFRAADFLPPDFLRADFLPADFRPPDDRPRRPPDRALPRDDRFFVAMALLSKLRGGCSHVSARIARALHRSAART
jgi:hypothetical protein